MSYKTAAEEDDWVDQKGNANGNGQAVVHTDENQWHTSKIDSCLIDPTGLSKDRITFPGYEGVPFRGPIPDLKNDDPEHMQPQQGQTAHVDVLDLSVPEDLEQYRAVSRVIANGFGAISYEKQIYDETKGSWRVLIRWLEYYAYNPGAAPHGPDRSGH